MLSREGGLVSGLQLLAVWVAGGVVCTILYWKITGFWKEVRDVLWPRRPVVRNSPEREYCLMKLDHEPGPSIFDTPIERVGLPGRDCDTGEPYQVGLYQATKWVQEKDGEWKVYARRIRL